MTAFRMLRLGKSIQESVSFTGGVYGGGEITAGREYINHPGDCEPLKLRCSAPATSEHVCASKIHFLALSLSLWAWTGA